MDQRHVQYYRDLIAQNPDKKDLILDGAYALYSSGNKFDTPPDLDTILNYGKQYQADQPFEITKGLKSKTQSMQGFLHGAVGLAGDMVGSDTIRDYGYEGYKRNMAEAQEVAPRVGRVEDINSIGDASDWLMGTIGGLGPDFGEMLATTFIGGMAGSAIPGAGTTAGAIVGAASRKAIREVIEGAIEKQVAKRIASGIEKDVAEKIVREEAESLITREIKKAAGKKAGLVLGVAPLEAGGMYGKDADERGIENANPWSAAVLGTSSAMTESSGAVGDLATNGLKRPTKAEAVKSYLSDSFGEAGQELVQTGLGDVNRLVNNPDAQISGSEYLNAGAGGFVGGSAAHLPSLGLSMARKDPKPPQDIIKSARGETGAPIKESPVGDGTIAEQEVAVLNKPGPIINSNPTETMGLKAPGATVPEATPFTKGLATGGIAPQSEIETPAWVDDQTAPITGKGVGLVVPSVQPMPVEERPAVNAGLQIAPETEPIQEPDVFNARAEATLDDGIKYTYGENKAGKPSIFAHDQTGKLLDAVTYKNHEIASNEFVKLTEPVQEALPVEQPIVPAMGLQAMPKAESKKPAVPAKGLSLDQDEFGGMGLPVYESKGVINESEKTKEEKASIALPDKKKTEAPKGLSGPLNIPVNPQINMADELGDMPVQAVEKKPVKEPFNAPEGVKLTSTGGPFKISGAKKAVANHTKATGEAAEVVDLGSGNYGWRIKDGTTEISPVIRSENGLRNDAESNRSGGVSMDIEGQGGNIGDKAQNGIRGEKKGSIRGVRTATKEGWAKVEKAQQALRDIINNPDIVGRQRADMIENGKNLIQYYQANAHRDLREDETGYHRGNLVAYTGEDAPDGFRSIIYLEGSEAGKNAYAPTEDTVRNNENRNKKEWEDQQDQFRRLRENQEKETPVVAKETPLDAPQTDLALKDEQQKEPEKDATSSAIDAQKKKLVVVRRKLKGGALSSQKKAELEAKESEIEGEIRKLRNQVFSDPDLIQKKEPLKSTTDAIKTEKPSKNDEKPVLNDEKADQPSVETVTEPVKAESSQTPDRRQDTDRRKTVSEMSPEEMKRELLTDYLTGLGNKRAYEESEKKANQVSIDADALKWVNDNLGHQVGDELLKQIGTALKQDGLEAYHISGDEYYIQNDSNVFLDDAIKKAYSYLKDNPIEVIFKDGTKGALIGSFSYGRGQNIEEAESRLQLHKTERELSGERSVRGQEPSGSIKRLAEGDTDQNKREDVYDLKSELSENPSEESAENRDIEIETSGSKKDVSVNISSAKESNLSPKEQKEYLLKEIDAAIKNAPDEQVYKSYSSKKEEILAAYEGNKAEFGVVEIHVPGDGSYTILNTKSSLEDFKKRAAGFPVSELRPVDRSRVSIPRPKRPDGLEGEYIKDPYKPYSKTLEIKKGDKKWFKQDGYSSNGGIIIKGDVKGTPSIERDPGSVKRIIDGLVIGKKAEDITEHYDSTGYHSSFIFVEAGGDQGIFNSDYFDAVLTRYKNADIFLGKAGPYESAIFKDGDEVVAVIAGLKPFSGDETTLGTIEEATKKRDSFRNSRNSKQADIGKVKADGAKTVKDGSPKFSKSTDTGPTATISELSKPQRAEVEKLQKAGKVTMATEQEAIEALKQAGLSAERAKYMVAYHGTPHDFDQFSMDKIGTGEGAQAYGYGLYFAESEDVANHYRETLSEGVSIDGKPINRYAFMEKVKKDQGYGMAVSSYVYDLVEDLGSVDEALSVMNGFKNDSGEVSSMIKKSITLAESYGERLGTVKLKGSLYKVELAPKENEYLLWEKPIQDQHNTVKESLKKALQERGFDAEQVKSLLSNKYDGNSIYTAIASNYGEPEASILLRKHGIRGIKYFDAYARSNKGENYNFVIFDDADVKITAKYSKDGKIQGFVLPDGKAYIIPSNIKQGNLWNVIRHEIGVHMGQLMQNRPEFNRILKTLENLKKSDTKQGELVRKAFDRVPKDTKPEHIAEEALAYLVESSPEIGIVRRFITMVKRLLVKMGVSPMIFNQADYAALADAAIRKEADRVPGVGKTMESMGQFAQDAKMSIDKAKMAIQNLPAFKKWFGDSKVVDEDGEPLVVYHGTRRDFTIFEPMNPIGAIGNINGIYFSDKKGIAEEYSQDDEGAIDSKSRVVPTYITINNPKIYDGYIRKTTTEELISSGHDGVIIKKADGSAEYVVFNPTQIKSIFNTKWNPENPDIMMSKRQISEPLYSISDAKDHVTEAFDDALEFPKDLYERKGEILSGAKATYKYRKDKGKNFKEDTTWIEKSFGLVSHYAKKIPAFARTFNAALRNGELKTMIEQHLTHGVDEDGKPERFIETINNFRRKFKSQYRKLDRYLHDRDLNQVGYRVKAVDPDQIAEMGGKFIIVDLEGKDTSHIFESKREAFEKITDLEVSDYIKDGNSEESARALRLFRTINNRSFDMRIARLEEIEKFCEENGIKLPDEVIVEGETIKVDLKAALIKMGDRRGYYMPRIRNKGEWVVYASKEGENPRTEYFDLKLRADFRRGQLENNGYRVTVKKAGNLSEDLFEQLGSVLSQQAIINESMEEINKGNKIVTLKDLDIKSWMDGDDLVMSGEFIQEFLPTLDKFEGEKKIKESYVGKAKVITYEYRFKNAKKGLEEEISKELFKISGATNMFQEVATRFAKAFVSQYADVIRSRGSRSAMIGRSDKVGQEVNLGFEEDALTRVVRATLSLAGGEAKSKTALSMIETISGRDVSWSKFSEIKRFKGTFEEFEKQVIDNDEQYIDRATFEEIKNNWVGAPQYPDYIEFVEGRGIDPALQKTAHAEAMALFKDMMRNDERADRVIGTLKGLAVLKYLGFRVAAPVVNMTNMVVGVPGAMAGYGKIPIRQAMKHIGKSFSEYRQFKKGELKNNTLKKVFEEIEKRGWDQAQFNHEGMAALQNKMQFGYAKIIETSMMMFTWSEKQNRVATISAAFKGLQTSFPDLTFEERLLKAKEISDKAHGIYGKANRPSVVRGGSVGANILQMGYVFKTFTHNFLATMADLAINEKDAKAVAWLLFSPAMFGLGASMGASWITSAIGSALGSDDPDEDLYKWVESTFGSYTENLARFGVFGALGDGISVKGSLNSVGVSDLPTSFKDLIGAPGSVVTDVIEGVGQIGRGNVMKGAESILPLAFGAPVKAYREYTEGITTKSNAPVFFEGKPLKADAIDAFLRALSFNPSRIAGAREKLWGEKVSEQAFMERRKDIYSRVKKYYLDSDRDPEDLQDIEIDIAAYNQRAKDSGQTVIKAKNIKSILKRAKIEE